MFFRFLSDLPAVRRAILSKLPYDILSEELISNDRDLQLSPTLPILVSGNKADHQLSFTVYIFPDSTRPPYIFSDTTHPACFLCRRCLLPKIDCTYRCCYGILTFLSLIHTRKCIRNVMQRNLSMNDFVIVL